MDYFLSRPLSRPLKSTRKRMPRLLVPGQATSKAPAEANTRFESARLWRFAARSLVGAISALTAVILVASSSVRASDTRWTFDADGARQEFVSRRSGDNELNTMGVLSVMATAQVEYFRLYQKDLGPDSAQIAAAIN